MKTIEISKIEETPFQIEERFSIWKNDYGSLTINIQIDGGGYEPDLSIEGAKKLYDFLGKYLNENNS